MCGIGGIFYRRECDSALLKERAVQIGSKLHHRGPDDSGQWIDERAGLALAHTRLSIIDLSQLGHQPMVSRNKRWVISYNGEIYNHSELRSELTAANVSLLGHSDTEIALEYIAHFGLQKALNAFNGMFAIALWNVDERKLYLIRDRVGIKPLYYGRVDGAWIFASELKALCGIPERPRQLNADALGVFMRHGYVTDDTCIFDEMHKVPPGAVVTISTQAESAATYYFWRLRGLIDDPNSGRAHESELEATDRLEQELSSAVKRRMIADVPLGAFLSGGIDSSLVVALMQQQSSDPVNTFTIGFDEKRFDESVHAGRVAAELGTNHTQLVVTSDDALNLVGDLATIYDEPFADPSQLPTIIVSRLAADHVTVALSGDGGDELFGGYTRYAKLASVWRSVQRLPRFLRLPVSNLLARCGNSAVLQNKILRLSAMLRATDSPEFYRSGISMLHDTSMVVPEASGITAGIKESDILAQVSSIEEQMMYTDFVTYLPGDILTKVDRASMNASLEVRVPLLDHRFVEAVWSTPWSVRKNDGSSKRLLTNVLHRHLDKKLFDRPKAGFSVPLASWLRGPLRDWTESLLASSTEELGDTFNIEAVDASWKGLLAGRDDQASVLWNTLIFLSWREAWCADQVL